MSSPRSSLRVARHRSTLRVMSRFAALIAASMAVAGMVGCGGDEPATARWPDRSEPIEATPPLAFLTNSGDDTVSVVELATMTEVARRYVGMTPVDVESPHHLAIDPAAGYVYVGLSNTGTREGGGLHGSHGGGELPSYVQRLRLRDLVPEGEARVDSNLGDVLLLGGGRVASTHFDLAKALDAATRGAPVEEGYGALVVVDASTMQRSARLAVCTAPHGMATTRDGRTGVVACYGDDAVAIVDLASDPPAVVARVPVGPMPGDVTSVRYGPYGVTIAPDEAFAYVGVLDGTSLRRIDLASRADVPEGAIVLEGAAFFGSFDPRGARFWVPTQARDTLARVDVASSTIAARRAFTREECTSPHEAIYVASIDRVLVVCEGDHVGPGRLLAVDPTSLEIAGSVAVGVYPDAVRISEAR